MQNLRIIQDIPFSLDPLHHAIQYNKDTSPPHTSTTVDQERRLMEGWVDLPHLPDEVDHGDSIGWHTMIRPPQVVQLSHLQGGFTWIRGLEVGSIFTLL